VHLNFKQNVTTETCFGTCQYAGKTEKYKLMF